MRARLILLTFLPLLSACEQRMAHMPRDDAYSDAPAFANGAEAQPQVAGTIAREDDLAPRPAGIPGPIDLAMLKRGQQRYTIFCAPCHSPSGDGDGLIVRRGFPHPPDFADAALRSATDAHFYDVITHGYGVMFPYAARISPADRWAIVAYLRALQLARHAEVASLPDDLRSKLDARP